VEVSREELTQHLESLSDEELSQHLRSGTLTPLAVEVAGDIRRRADQDYPVTSILFPIKPIHPLPRSQRGQPPGYVCLVRS
jgi:hypothetical protein